MKTFEEIKALEAKSNSAYDAYDRAERAALRTTKNALACGPSTNKPTLRGRLRSTANENASSTPSYL